MNNIANKHQPWHRQRDRLTTAYHKNTSVQHHNTASQVEGTVR